MESPSSKVTAGGAAGVIVAAVVELVRWQWDVEVPPAVSSGLVVLVSLVVAYVTRETRPPASVVEAVRRAEHGV